MRPDCVLWTGWVTAEGYGERLVDGRRTYVHRLAYEEANGPIPNGLVIDHLCRERRCINPGHLEAVSSGVNVLRGEGACARNARKTHCKHGHEFTPENTRWFGPDGRHRKCIECDRRQSREARARRRSS